MSSETRVTQQAKSIGAVAIGRNEGSRLERCLESLLADPNTARVVYVDSNSSDGSCEYARKLGVEVVELDTTKKFTAARARNAGFRRLAEIDSKIEFVQFVDGDCELQAGWLDAALSKFETDERIAVVCGRRRERFPEYSLYNKLCDMEWDTPVGEAQACGGDALIALAALQEVGGYKAELIAGEEPEMCFRLRQRGYRIWRIDQEMTLHDANISSPGQWFRRAKRSGHAFAEHATLHGAEGEHLGVRRTLSNLVWGAAIPGAVGALALGAGPLAATVAGTAAYGYLYKKSLSHARARRSEHDARLEAVGWVAGKIPEALGAFSYLRARALGRQTKLLEYK